MPAYVLAALFRFANASRLFARFRTHYDQKKETFTVFKNVGRYAIKAEQQSRQIKEEKKKTEFLLHQMLPKSIAQELLEHKSVKPEYYDEVSIYFSDIVGFTKISSQCKAIEIVDLLNGLYGLFDGLIDKYDVYKVETIGDAYMITSGLPDRNGNRHARELAYVSFDLLRAVFDYEPPCTRGERLRLRIGIHTGPVAAGVVGLKMPRYCLFGDSVNTASRMESYGAALKIHISNDTKRCLEQYSSGFITEARDILDVKGKGKMQTYWLVSCEEEYSTRRRVVLSTQTSS